MKHSTAVAAVIFALLVSSLHAEESAKWTVRPLKVDHPPVLDGRLTDDVWRGAVRIDNFTQQDPDLGEPASERTEVYLLYTSTHLYIGVIFFDTEPDQIVHNIFSRDGPLFQDDSLIVAIDANNDHRTSAQIAVNANGARVDREVTEGETFTNDFDFYWRVATSIDERGIVFEIEIPFNVLSFKPAEEYEMGLLFRRQIPRKNERDYWPALSRDFNYTNASRYGRMVGLRGLDLGRNLELAPSFIAGGNQTADDDELDIDTSFDARWGITSNLIADFTANTDFAQVEADELQVNLTRFRLFFPEKREFFLENSKLFQFGSPDEAEAFFSRRIGIYRGEKVPIIGGARLQGLIGETNVGVLAMKTDSTSAIDSENFVVGRVKQNILERSTIGAIITSRSGVTGLEDTTVGFDARHVWGSSNTLFLDVARSDRSQLDDDQWYFNTGYELSSDLVAAHISYLDISENYQPGIGFVQRPDQRRLLTSGAYKPRPGWDAVRQLRFFGSYSRIEDHAGILETENVKFQQNTYFESNDALTFEFTNDFDLIFNPFEIAPNVVIPPGKYRFSRYRAQLATDYTRAFYTDVSFRWGSFYGGDIRTLSAFALWKVTPRFHLETSNNFNHVELPRGSFDSNVHRLLASYYFSPDLNIRVAAQYSTLDEHLVFNMRMRWIFGKGSEAWLVYDENREFDLPLDSLRNRALIGKLVYRFRM